MSIGMSKSSKVSTVTWPSGLISVRTPLIRCSTICIWSGRRDASPDSAVMAMVVPVSSFLYTNTPLSLWPPSAMSSALLSTSNSCTSATKPSRMNRKRRRNCTVM
jgi:hypothetical protein